MNPIRFSATLETASLQAHPDDDKTIRRVRFRFSLPFALDMAEWLGPDALEMRRLMVSGQLSKFSMPLDVVTFKAVFDCNGTAEATLEGVAATAKMSGGEEPEPLLALEFEAFPEAKLLTWLAASLKAECDVDLAPVQTEIEVARAT